MVYFLQFTIIEIPHLTWGSKLTTDYHQRAQVFAVRFSTNRLGIISFYTLPLLPCYASTDYTPEVLQGAVYTGAFMTVLGLIGGLYAAPTGAAVKTVHEDSWRLFVHSLLQNQPSLIYFLANGCIGLAGGMWYALVYFYLDSYPGPGSKVALMFMLSTVVFALSTPSWLKLVHATSKSTVWTVGIILFICQMIAALFLVPGVVWWIPFVLVLTANLFFTCNNVTSPAILGDIVDYGRWKFHKDRGATYFGFNTLIFKIGLGIALGIAGGFGFDPASVGHSDAVITGLKLGFLVLPILFAAIGTVWIWRTPIDKRRHQIIQRRLKSRS